MARVVGAEETGRRGDEVGPQTRPVSRGWKGGRDKELAFHFNCLWNRE